MADTISDYTAARYKHALLDKTNRVSTMKWSVYISQGTSIARKHANRKWGTNNIFACIW